MSPTSAEASALAAIALPVVAGLVAYALGRLSRTARDWAVVAALSAELGLAARIARAGAAPGLAIQLAAPSTGLPGAGLALAVGPLTGLAVVLVALVWLATGAFSIGYVQPARAAGGYFALLLLALGAAVGATLSADLLTLAGFLALLGILLGALVGLDAAPGATAAATKLLLLFVGAAALLAVSAWLVVAAGGSPRLDEDLARGARLGEWSPLAPGLVAAVAALLAGLAPLHTWLIAAARRTFSPVVALLAAGVLPIGLALWLRALGPWAGPSDVSSALALLGALSLVVAALGALRTRGLLPSLAFQAVGQAGLAAIALGQAGAEGRAAAAYSGAAAALALPVAVLGASAVLQVAGSDALGDFARLRALQPAAAALALVGAASLAGVPPFPGYWSRVWLVELLLRGGPSHLAVLALVFVASAVLALGLLRLLQAGAPPALPAGPGRAALVAPLALLALGLVLLTVVPREAALGLAAPGGAAPGRSLSGAAAALLALLALALAGALRLGELALLPARVQAWFEAGASALAVGGRAISWGQKRVDAAWLDPYAIVGGLLLAAGRASALLLDNTLGRLGRRG